MRSSIRTQANTPFVSAASGRALQPRGREERKRGYPVGHAAQVNGASGRFRTIQKSCSKLVASTCDVKFSAFNFSPDATEEEKTKTGVFVFVRMPNGTSRAFAENMRDALSDDNIARMRAFSGLSAEGKATGNKKERGSSCVVQPPASVRSRASGSQSGGGGECSTSATAAAGSESSGSETSVPGGANSSSADEESDKESVAESGAG